MHKDDFEILKRQTKTYIWAHIHTALTRTSLHILQTGPSLRCVPSNVKIVFQFNSYRKNRIKYLSDGKKQYHLKIGRLTIYCGVVQICLKGRNNPINYTVIKKIIMW